MLQARIPPCHQEGLNALSAKQAIANMGGCITSKADLAGIVKEASADAAVPFQSVSDDARRLEQGMLGLERAMPKQSLWQSP